MIVIIISYISYKIKAEKNPVIEEEKKKLNNLYMPQRIINHNTEKVIAHYKPEPIPVVANYSENYQQNYSNQSFNKKANNNTTYYKTKASKPRIQIMNNHPQFKKNNFNQNNNRTELKTSTDIHKYNLLNYYDESNNNRLVSIKVLPVSH